MSRRTDWQSEVCVQVTYTREVGAKGLVVEGNLEMCKEGQVGRSYRFLSSAPPLPASFNLEVNTCPLQLKFIVI